MDRKTIRKITGFTFEKNRDNADLWYKHAVSFHEASIVLNENQRRISSGLHVFLFTAALSIELIFKAIVVAQGKKVPKIHKLQELCAVAKLDLNEDQMATLDLLTEIIFWLGRYPAPASEEEWNQFHDEIFEKLKVRSQSGNTWSVGAHPKRFPSMDNYIEIWNACRAKYAEASRKPDKLSGRFYLLRHRVF